MGWRSRSGTLATYSCDHLVEPAFKLGNIKDKHMIELIASPQQKKFGLDKRDTLPRFCRECDVRFACHGGCPKDRFTDDPYGEPGLNYLCPSFKAFFHHVDGPMRAMSELLTDGRAPSELVRAYATEDAERGPQRAVHVRLGTHVDAMPRCTVARVAASVVSGVRSVAAPRMKEGSVAAT